jgi:N-acetylneuraminic acid mutarotase
MADARGAGQSAVEETCVSVRLEPFEGTAVKRHLSVSVLAAIVVLTPPVWTTRVVTVLAAPVHGTWSMAPSMPGPVTSHQAVVLRDGRVLVIGGEPVEGWPVPWVQLYDPSAGTWTMVASMHVARIGESATLLNDGRVLVVGGLNRKLESLASAEIFDPRRSTWTLLPPLAQSRFSQSASMLPDGRVLLVGGIVAGGISRTTLLFDPKQDRFMPGPETRGPHAQQCAVTLNDGRLLIAGGYGGGPEVYDPQTHTWTVVGPIALRAHPVMSPLPDGTVLLASGVNPREKDLRSAMIFHPAGRRWTATAPLHARRDTATGTLLPNGRVLVVGGEQVAGDLVRSAELYDPGKHTWLSAGALRVARTGATASLLHSGAVLICGGANFNGPLASCETFHPPGTRSSFGPTSRMMPPGISSVGKSKPPPESSVQT